MKTSHDIYSQVTDAIVAALEAGAGDWQMPWHRASGSLARPVNVASGKAYRGVNVVMLWASAQANGYRGGVWGTFKQWQAAGAQVRKGERGTPIVFWKEIETEDTDAETGEAERGTRLIAKGYHVFNADQVDGYTLPAEPEAPAHDTELLAAAEAFAAGTRARITWGGDRAFYSLSADAVYMPDRARFHGTNTSTGTETLYSTLMHELVHWSGASHRCARPFGQRFGDKAYAMEELVAELGAAFLCADLGITNVPRVDHAAYLQSWLGVLKADKRAIFTAASKAAAAVDYLHAIQGDDAGATDDHAPALPAPPAPAPAPVAPAMRAPFAPRRAPRPKQLDMFHAQMELRL